MRQPSSNRKRAFVGAIGSWAVSVGWLAPLLESPSPQWPVAALVGIAALGALGSSAVVIEVRRSLVQDVSAWTDAIHIRWVLFWAVVLFILQFTGIQQVITPASELAS